MTSPILLEREPLVGKVTVNILLVDDDVRNLDVLESILTSPGYRLVRAQTAQEALMALLDGEFAAIVLDIQMPGTNGIELAQLIKQRKRTQHIPIIFLTAYFHEDREVLQGYEVGAVDYLSKPVNPEILKSKIAVFVELFKKTRELLELNIAMGLEITQRKIAEEALRQAKNELESRVEERTAKLTRAISDLNAGEHRYRQLVASLPAAVYTTDARGCVELFNEAAVVLLGRRPEVGKDLWHGSYRVYRPDGISLPLDESPMAITLREGTSVRGEEIIIERPDGTRRHVLPYPDPIRDPSGDLVGTINMLLDITDSKRAEEASRRLAAIVESSDDAIVSKDLNGIIATWNGGAERLFGYKAEEVIGKSISLLIPTERLNEEPKILERIRCGERIDQYETVRRRKDGSLIEVSLAISPIRDGQGRVIGASKIVHDITRHKQAERELERAHVEALAASRAKDDFLAALSHELRTPLNPVLLIASEAAEDRHLPTEIRDQFTAIRDNVELEARLIDDLLDLTHIRYGKLSLNLDLVDVHELLSKAFETVRSEAHRKVIEVTLALEADNSTVKGDAVRLQQVFWNVIKNAVKFTSAGGKISVGTCTTGVTGELIVTIADNGIGITSEELLEIFEPFAQGEHGGAGESHHFGGLGLGLAISRTLIELHGGSIHASSAGRGQGSTFSITLPLTAAERSGRARPLPGHLFPARTCELGSADTIHILLVEDHEATRNALANLLARRRYGVKTAASVAEARRLAGEQEFHILISDIGLPDGNGFELMKELRIRQKGLLGIALTGYGMEQDVACSREAGFGSHLTKPVRVQSLETALATLLSTCQQLKPSPDTESTTGASRSSSVLLG